MMLAKKWGMVLFLLPKFLLPSVNRVAVSKIFRWAGTFFLQER